MNALKYEPSFEKYKIVANIPYNITGRLLRHFLEEVKNKPESLTLMVQKEVAEKVIQNEPNHNLLSLSVRVFGEPRLVCYVPSSKFYPPPKVDSAIIHIDLFKEPKVKRLDVFFELIRKAFQGKRKMIRKTLNIDSDILNEINVEETVRPQEITLEEWAKLVNRVTQ
jgi:16S rRNA (adenine1518-N6/adenine1519-N6)-dimethyltransferase